MVLYNIVAVLFFKICAIIVMELSCEGEMVFCTPKKRVIMIAMEVCETPGKAMLTAKV